jgi:hypothetical protein
LDDSEKEFISLFQKHKHKMEQRIVKERKKERKRKKRENGKGMLKAKEKKNIPRDKRCSSQGFYDVKYVFLECSRKIMDTFEL